MSRQKKEELEAIASQLEAALDLDQIYGAFWRAADNGFSHCFEKKRNGKAYVRFFSHHDLVSSRTVAVPVIKEIIDGAKLGKSGRKLREAVGDRLVEHEDIIKLNQNE